MPEGGEETLGREPAQSRSDKVAEDAGISLGAPDRLTSNSCLCPHPARVWGSILTSQPGHFP